MLLMQKCHTETCIRNYKLLQSLLRRKITAGLDVFWILCHSYFVTKIFAEGDIKRLKRWSRFEIDWSNWRTRKPQTLYPLCTDLEYFHIWKSAGFFGGWHTERGLFWQVLFFGAFFRDGGEEKHRKLTGEHLIVDLQIKMSGMDVRLCDLNISMKKYAQFWARL